MSTLTTVTNLRSMNILSSMNKAQINMGKSLQRLSSGEAISSSFDDPSGFTISERMRDYIQGLKKASSNAQNGISYLQTAEGATKEINSMLQRMRELAVESSNGIYTTNDRQELQKEMEQLKSEIDRISETTQFNTKKLLDGSSAGAWNSGTSKVSAIITGSIADGNYDIALNVDPGKNQVSKSQILTIKEGKLGAQVNSSGTSNIASVRDPQNILTSKDGNYEISVTDKFTAGDTINLASAYQQDKSLFATDGATSVVSANQSGYMQIEFTESKDNANLAGTNFRVRFISAETGEEGAWVNFSSAVDNSLSGTYTAGGMNVSFQLPITTGTSSKVTAGDSLLFNVSDNKGMTDTDTLLTSGGGTLQISQDGVTGPFITYTNPNSLTKGDNLDGVKDFNTVTVYMARLDAKTGQLDKGSLSIDFAENSQPARANGVTLSGIATVEVRGGGEPATATTRLNDIKNFTTTEGNNLLQSTQELTIYGNNGKAIIYIEKNDTIDDLNQKFTQAIGKTLGLASGNTAADNNIAQYVSNGGGLGFTSVPGTILLQTPVTGDDGKIYFGGGESLLKAFGFQNMQEAENNKTNVTIKNNRTGVIEGVTNTDSGVAKDLIKGLDIAFDARAYVGVNWNAETGVMEFEESINLDSRNMTLHIVDNRTMIQIGTMKGETMDVSIPQVDTNSLGINDAVITSQEDAQNAISKFDGALSKIVSVRATIGSQISRLEKTINVLGTTTLNMQTADSRIRDADFAMESSNLAMAQLMYQTDIAVMAQANQIPSMTLSLLQR